MEENRNLNMDELDLEQMDSVAGGRAHTTHIVKSHKVCPQCGTTLNLILNPVARTGHYSCPNCHFKGKSDDLIPAE